MKKEEWRPVVGYEGLYEVSSRGRVRGLGIGRFRRAGIRKPTLCRGYLVIGLCRDGGCRTVPVHRLVAEAFIGPCPPGLVTNHKDGNKLNLRPENLEWVTRADNIRHAFAYGLTNNTGSKHGMSKLTEAQARKIMKTRGQEPAHVTARKYGISQGQVFAIRLGYAWKHLHKDAS